jgi:hypothetical protein
MSFRWLTLLALAPVLTAAACSSKTAPKPTDPVAFVAWDTYLDTAVDHSFKARHDGVVRALGGIDADVACITGVYRESDKALVRDAVQAVLPYSAWVTTSLDSAPNDPADQNGNVPPAPTAAACAPPDIAPALDTGLACVIANCSTIPNSDQGYVSGYDCMYSKCLSDAAALLANKRCFNCAFEQIEDKTIAQMKSECTTDPKAQFALEGQNGIVLLSKQPLANPELYVLPSTYGRRGILRASITTPKGSDVDVYCAELTGLYQGLTNPYSGDYGEGDTGDEGWVNENAYQVQQMLSWVEAKSPNAFAVVLGNIRGSVEVDDASGKAIVVGNNGDEAIKSIESKLTPSVAAGYPPACTECPENGWNANVDPTWGIHIYQKGIPADHVSETERVFTDQTVSFAGANRTPSISTGLRSVIRVDAP